MSVINQTQKVFGNNRIDYYYFFPYYLSQVSGQINIDWSTNRKDFVLHELPLSPGLSYITINNISLQSDIEHIDTVAFNKFAKREFQIQIK